MHVGWRREITSPPASGGDEALAAAIRSEIETGGPITFARFMERALYDPDGGYYATATNRQTRAGDFLTAPELHPVFGRTLARQVDEMWRHLKTPDEFLIREYGAGSGALFVSIVDGLAAIQSELASILRYEPVDFARQREVIRERVAKAGREAQLVPISEHGTVRTGVVLANEFADALPVHRVIRLNGALREILVDWRDGAFVEVAGPLSDERIASWFTDADLHLVEGQRAEVNLAMLDWVRDLATQLERGYVVVIDYGAGSRELYGPDRPNGTIRAFAGQRVSSDVLSQPGSRDITSSVDFDALEREARACGFEVAGRRRSSEFLLACGLDDAYGQARAESEADWDATMNLRSAIQRLLDPNALGGYLVTVLAKNAPIDPPLRGFAPLAGTR